MRTMLSRCKVFVFDLYQIQIQKYSPRELGLVRHADGSSTHTSRFLWISNQSPLPSVRCPSRSTFVYTGPYTDQHQAIRGMPIHAQADPPSRFQG